MLGVAPSVEVGLRGVRGVLSGLVGAAVGFIIATAVYLRVNPILEAANGPVRELQGLVWNIVPLLTVSGFVLGVWLMSRRPRGPTRPQGTRKRSSGGSVSGKD